MSGLSHPSPPPSLAYQSVYTDTYHPVHHVAHVWPMCAQGQQCAVQSKATTEMPCEPLRHLASTMASPARCDPRRSSSLTVALMSGEGNPVLLH